MGQFCSPSGSIADANTVKKPSDEDKLRTDEEEPDGEFNISFSSRPLGFGCDQGTRPDCLVVSSIQEELLLEQHLSVGCLIVGVNGNKFGSIPHENMIHRIKDAMLPVELNFSRDKEYIKQYLNDMSTMEMSQDDDISEKTE